LLKNKSFIIFPRLITNSSKRMKMSESTGSI
jgi:hypothetical protein